MSIKGREEDSSFIFVQGFVCCAPGVALAWASSSASWCSVTHVHTNTHARTRTHTHTHSQDKVLASCSSINGASAYKSRTSSKAQRLALGWWRRGRWGNSFCHLLPAVRPWRRHNAHHRLWQVCNKKNDLSDVHLLLTQYLFHYWHTWLRPWRRHYAYHRLWPVYTY